MDQFVLVGDSITQQSFSQARGFSFGAALADAYQRRLDIVNRGLSGYNTTQALRALPLCMPEAEHSRVRLLLLFFGANDARIAGSPGGPDQSVPLDEFKRNLKAMVHHPAVRAHEGVKVILVTPPPIDERMCLKADQERFPSLGRILRRTAANTATYAQGVRDLGQELGLPVLDVWSAMVTRSGNTRDQPICTGSIDAGINEVLQSYLHDGLHFSGEGYKVLYGELMALVERTWPEEMPGRLAMRLPAWDDTQAWKESVNGSQQNKDGKYLASGVFEAVVNDVQKIE